MPGVLKQTKLDKKMCNINRLQSIFLVFQEKRWNVYYLCLRSNEEVSLESTSHHTDMFGTANTVTNTEMRLYKKGQTLRMKQISCIAKLGFILQISEFSIDRFSHDLN